MQDVHATSDRFELGRWIAATLGASAGAFLLGLDAAIWLLLGAQALDFVSGVLAAGIQRELDSRVGWNGLVRKVLVWCQVGVAALIHRYLESFGAHVAVPLPAIGELQLPAIGLVAAVCVGYGAVELMSVAENCKRGGIWVPTWLTDRLGRFQPTPFDRPRANLSDPPGRFQSPSFDRPLENLPDPLGRLEPTSVDRPRAGLTDRPPAN